VPSGRYPNFYPKPLAAEINQSKRRAVSAFSAPFSSPATAAPPRPPRSFWFYHIRSTDLQSLSLSRPHLANDKTHALHHGYACSESTSASLRPQHMRHFLLASRWIYICQNTLLRSCQDKSCRKFVSTFLRVLPSAPLNINRFDFLFNLFQYNIRIRQLNESLCWCLTKPPQFTR
jgi:hypothetical protein